MAKLAPKITTDLSEAGRTKFTLTFAIEILGMDIWHDCNEGWLDLGLCNQGMKIQYQLYPGQIFDLDILIWPHAVKIWCGANSGWVRTWQFLDRRWLSFDVCHIFPVRVAELQAHVATIIPTLGLGAVSANAKNDKITEVYLPRLEFGQQRYFAPVVSEESSLEQFMYDLIWKTVEHHIPVSFMDGLFNVPHPVTDVRHQDAVLYHVKERTLAHDMSKELDQDIKIGTSVTRKPSIQNRNTKKVEGPKSKFEIKLPGDIILAGVGRQVLFEAIGDRPSDLGEIIVLISSHNLPAPDDVPIFFVNIDSLFNVPADLLRKYQITHIYTQWSIGEEVHDSEPQVISRSKSTYELNDHHAVPLPCDIAFNMMSCLVDEFYRIQLRGIRQPLKLDNNPQFFGYAKKDRVFATNYPPKFKDYETDIVIANTKIAARSLAKGISGIVKGEFALFPPTLTVASLGRESLCTNDQNGIKLPLIPEQVVPSYVILDAQMTIQVRLGFAGCKPRRLEKCYSRMICLITDTLVIMEMLKQVDEINNELEQANERDKCLTGFAVDTGDTVIFYVEGPNDGAILQLWEKTGDYFPHTNPIFSSSARYAFRVYPVSTFATTVMPFMVLKMYAPLSAILACPPVYAKPVLPALTRSAALKFGRLLANRLRWLAGPPTSEMPTAAELISFRQELCVPPKSPNAYQCSVFMMTCEHTCKHNFNNIRSTNWNPRPI